MTGGKTAPTASLEDDACGQKTTSIYRPEIISENPITLDPKLTEYSPTLLSAIENGMIQVKLDEEVVKQRISYNMYEKPSSGLRELFANELRACHTARDKHGAIPRIEITINPGELSRKLSIRGYDSMGISEELFISVVRYLGRSDNFSGNEPGQFGFGLASYTCLSDIMTLETYSRQTGKKFAVIGKSGIGFNILPESDIDSYGTKITLTLRDDININNLISSLEQFVRFCDIDVFLVLEDDLNTSNTPYSAGINTIKRMTFSQYLDTTLGRRILAMELKMITHLSIEIREDGYEFYGRFSFIDYELDTDAHGTNTHYIPGTRNSQNTLLLGLPIGAEISLPVPYYVLNILDERMYKPTTDRERLSEDAVNVLQDRITQKITDVLAGDDIENLSDFNTCKYRMLYDNIQKNTGIGQCVSDNVNNILSFLNQKIVLDTGKRVTIKNIVKKGKIPVRLRSMRSSKVLALRGAIKNAQIFKFIPSNNPDAEEMIAKLRGGVIDGDEYIIKNDLHAVNGATLVMEVPVKYRVRRLGNCYKADTKKVMSDRIEDHMIRVTPKQIKTLYEVMYNIESKYMAVIERKYLNGGLRYADFMRQIGEMRVQTNFGSMIMNQVVLHGKPVVVVKHNDTNFVRHLKSDDTLIILHDGDEMFQIVTFLLEYAPSFSLEQYNSMNAIWNALDMNKFMDFDDFDVPDVYDETRIETMVGVISTAKALKNKHVVSLFLQSFCMKDSKKNMSDTYTKALNLDKSLTKLLQKASQC